MKHRTIVLFIVIVLLFSLAFISVQVTGKEEDVKVEKEEMDYEEIHNHPQSMYDNPMAPPKEIDDSIKKNMKRKYKNRKWRKQRKEDTTGLLDKSKDFLTDQWREGEKMLGYPWRKMNRWMHSMFDRREGDRRRPYTSKKERGGRRYDSLYPYQYSVDTDFDRWNYRPSWSWEEEEEDRWPSLTMMERPVMKMMDYFKDQWNQWEQMIPFHSRFDKIASSVNEKDDRFIFKVVNVPEQLKKDDLNVKLSSERGRDILDITSKLETEDESDFFEKKYIFPKNVDKKSIRAKFDDKERILTVEVYKLKGEENLINVPID